MLVFLNRTLIYDEYISHIVVINEKIYKASNFKLRDKKKMEEMVGWMERTKNEKSTRESVTEKKKGNEINSEKRMTQ